MSKKIFKYFFVFLLSSVAFAGYLKIYASTAYAVCDNQCNFDNPDCNPCGLNYDGDPGDAYVCQNPCDQGRCCVGGSGCTCECSSATSPSAPTLSYPANGVTKIAANSVYLTWTAPASWGQNTTSCATGSCVLSDTANGHAYDLFLTTNASATPPSGDCTSTTCYASNINKQYALVSIDSCTTYYWAVRARSTNSCTKFSAWTTKRSFRTNCNPSVVSISPNLGTSGTLINEPYPLGITSCDDFNPRTFRITVSDPDGASDIARTILTFNPTAAENYKVNNGVGYYGTPDNYYSYTVRGAIIAVEAAPDMTGTCNGVYPVMRMLINGQVASQVYTVTSQNRYYFVYPQPLRGQDIRIEVLNDCYNGDGNDTNLLVRSVYINSTLLQSATGIFANYASGWRGINGVNNYLTFTDSTYAGSSTMDVVGAVYNDVGLICNGTVTPECYQNYLWGFAVPSGSYVLKATAKAQPNTTAPSLDAAGSSSASAFWRKIGEGTVDANTMYVDVEIGFNRAEFSSPLNMLVYVSDYAIAASAQTSTRYVDTGDYYQDFTPPGASINSVQVASQSTFNVNWSASDATGVRYVVGQGGLFGSTYTNISTSNHYLTNSADTSLRARVEDNLDNYVNSRLWATLFNPALNTPTGTATIDIDGIDNGNVGFRFTSMDCVCNVTSTTYSSGNVGRSWLTSRGGMVYSLGVIDIPVKNLTPTTSIPSYPSAMSAYAVSSNQFQVSTEMLFTGGTSIRDIINRSSSSYNPFTLVNYTDNNNHSIYDSLISNISDAGVGDVLVTNSSTLSGKSSTYCGASAHRCLIRYGGNITVSSGFACDVPTIVIADRTGGTNTSITINPDIIVSSSGSSLQGCIFLASGDININEGTYKSSGATVGYDLVNGFLIADGRVILNPADTAMPTADGLVINGAIFAVGGQQSVVYRRTLKLRDNNLLPAVMLNYDPRYLFISPLFIKQDESTYIKEVGYKPY